jgi:hypothetical protein
MSPRELAALIIAPPLAPVVLVTVMAFPNYMGDYFQSIQIVALFGIPIAYLIALCLGLPLYFFAKDHRWVNFWSLSLGGAVVADLPALLTLLFLYDTWEAGRDWKLHGTFLITGFVVGAVFWSVLRFLPPNPTLKRVCAKARSPLAPR